MKGGFSYINSDSFIPFAHVSITGQRPSSPESFHHYTYEGGPR